MDASARESELRARLESLEAERRALFDDAPDAVFVADGELRILDANRHATRILGRSREELVGVRVPDLIAPEDLATRPPLLDWLRTGERLSIQRAMVLPDGGRVVLDVLAQRTSDGRFVGFARDVTERSRSDEKLRRSEESLRKLIDTLPDGILVHDGGRAVYVSPTLDRMLGYPEGSLVGRVVLDAVHPDDRAKVAERMAALYAPGAPSSLPFLEERLVRSDGTSITCEIAALRVLFEGKDAVVAVIRDITDRLRTQAELAHADRMTTVGRLAAGVAHEINNPLTFVLLNLEHQTRVLESHLANGSPISHETLRMLSQGAKFAHEGAERVARIVRDLRTLGRREEEPFGLLDVNEVLESALTLTTHEIEARGRVVRRFETGATLIGSEGRLCQVFVNLLVNAAHALNPEKAEQNVIEVETSGDRDSVRVVVRDNGPGMSPQVLERVFEPYFTTKPPATGTGLGLPISRDIVRLHGGDIRIVSSAESGTCVEVVLPRKPASRAPSVPEMAAVSIAKKRLLVIDDDEPVLRSISDLLEERYDVTRTGTSEEGQRLLETSSFDLVLCDVALPGTSGPDLSEWARRTGIVTPFLLMSGAGTDSQRRARGAAGYLEKPFRGTALVLAIEAALGHGPE